MPLSPDTTLRSRQRSAARRALGACVQPLVDAARVELVPAQEEERTVLKFETSDRKLEASREGSKRTPSVTEVSDGERFVVQGYPSHKKRF